MTDVVEKTRSGTIFIRPLRDITSAEIATALRLENVENYALPEREGASIPSLHLCEASKTVSLQEMSSKFLTHFVEEGFEARAVAKTTKSTGQANLGYDYSQKHVVVNAKLENCSQQCLSESANARFFHPQVMSPTFQAFLE
ncbi:unnamed protein product [Cylicostephanus goldi]|uniref:Uncharacterized protein n=1 Tax=Cylicostephanus goldi TaxID=71465 RepID=A0A3P6RZC3_CYLGO|nr:unnamed protein product [Cylicostephanus goldi]